MTPAIWATKLGLGTFVAQLATLIGTQIIAHLYVPSEYAVYSIGISMAGVILPLVTLKLETILAISEDNQEVNSIARIVIYLTLLSSILIFSIKSILSIQNVYVIPTSVYAVFNNLIIILIAQAIVTLASQIALNEKRYNKLGVYGVIQNVSTSLFQSALSLLPNKEMGLAIGFLIGRTFSATYLTLENLFKRNKKRVSHKSLMFVLSKQFKASKYLIFGSLAEALSYALPTIWVGYAFGLHYSGIVGMTLTLLLVPMTLVGGSIGSVILAESAIPSNSEDSSNKFISNMLKRFTRFMLLTAIGYLTCALIFSTYFLGWILPDSWSETTKLATILSLPCSIIYFWYPFVNVLFAKRQWKTYWKISLVRVISGILLAGICTLFKFEWNISVFLIMTASAIVVLLSYMKVIRPLVSLHSL